MGLRRLRRRLDDLQSHAHHTLASYDVLAEELQDGFTVEAEINMPAAVKMFKELFASMAGKQPQEDWKELPIRFRVIPDEADDAVAYDATE